MVPQNRNWSLRGEPPSAPRIAGEGEVVSNYRARLRHLEGRRRPAGPVSRSDALDSVDLRDPGEEQLSAIRSLLAFAVPVRGQGIGLGVGRRSQDLGRLIGDVVEVAG